MQLQQSWRLYLAKQVTIQNFRSSGNGASDYHYALTGDVCGICINSELTHLQLFGTFATASNNNNKKNKKKWMPKNKCSRPVPGTGHRQVLCLSFAEFWEPQSKATRLCIWRTTETQEKRPSTKQRPIVHRQLSNTGMKKLPGDASKSIRRQICQLIPDR